MRYVLLVFIICIGFAECKKSDGNSAPVIKFKSITPIYPLSNTSKEKPLLTIQVSDADGDLGFNDGKDTSYIYIKNITIGPPYREDSFKFPSSLSILPKTAFNNFVNVEIDLNGLSGGGRALAYTNRTGARKDTTYYEVFVKDFGKNKSNVIRTDVPLVFVQF